MSMDERWCTNTLSLSLSLSGHGSLSPDVPAKRSGGKALYGTCVLLLSVEGTAVQLNP